MKGMLQALNAEGRLGPREFCLKPYEVKTIAMDVESLEKQIRLAEEAKNAPQVSQRQYRFFHAFLGLLHRPAPGIFEVAFPPQRACSSCS